MNAKMLNEQLTGNHEGLMMRMTDSMYFLCGRKGMVARVRVASPENHGVVTFVFDYTENMAFNRGLLEAPHDYLPEWEQMHFLETENAPVEPVDLNIPLNEYLTSGERAKPYQEWLEERYVEAKRTIEQLRREQKK